MVDHSVLHYECSVEFKGDNITYTTTPDEALLFLTGNSKKYHVHKYTMTISTSENCTKEILHYSMSKVVYYYEQTQRASTQNTPAQL